MPLFSDCGNCKLGVTLADAQVLEVIAKVDFAVCEWFDDLMNYYAR